MQIHLYNTLTRQRERFTPAEPSRVTMYVCGPTVYHYAHIGNGRPAVIFDLAAKLLRRHFPGVIYARNITDVDDKINTAAATLGVPISVITDRFTSAYHQDMAALGVAAPDIEPRATATIPPIVAMIERLIVSGNAYAADGHVLFAVDSFADYGKLSGRSVDEMIAGARVEVAPYKRNPADFVLWKPSTPELPGWDSPWGRGRPGWHIECSAMIETHLGETIDIHAGGADLKFPHHENEVAQSTCAHGGRIFARYWLHNGFVTVDGAKMSKSLGNTLTVNDLRAKYPPEALRYFLLKAHYRQPLDWSASGIEQIVRTLDGLYGTLRDLEGIDADPQAPVPEAIEGVLCDDLNTPRALAALAELAGDARKADGPASKSTRKSALLAGGRMLGLLQQDPEQWFKRPISETMSASVTMNVVLGVANPRIDELVAKREAARQRKDFVEADAIRDQLAAEGIALEDSASGARWRRVSGNPP